MQVIWDHGTRVDMSQMTYYDMPHFSIWKVELDTLG